jgi:flagellar hook protein FlgE
VDNGAFIAPAEGTNIQFNNQGTIIAPAGPPVGVLNYAGIVVDTGAADMDFSFDMSEISQFGSAFGINALSQDGYSTGRLSGLEFDSDGQLFAKFTNGTIQSLGQVALANFSNPEGLQQLGDTTWAEWASSGEALIGQPKTGTLGSLQSSALEDSTVELTKELVELIVAQRNFQANAQVIRAADELQQTIVNLS